jgi:hypothetical protein
MPFKSEKQRKFLYANKPKLAKEFAEKEQSASYRPKKKKKPKRK